MNGKAIGSPQETKQFTATFANVSYARGELTAVAYDSMDKIVEKKTIQSAGQAAHIRLTPDRSKTASSRNDLSYVTAEVIDAKGNLIHNAAVRWLGLSSCCGRLLSRAFYRLT